MTYKEAISKGYIEAHTALSLGYVSRKINPDEQPLQKPGGMYRKKKGLYYVALPHPFSTRYYIRQYLVNPAESE